MNYVFWGTDPPVDYYRETSTQKSIKIDKKGSKINKNDPKNTIKNAFSTVRNRENIPKIPQKHPFLGKTTLKTPKNPLFWKRKSRFLPNFPYSGPMKISKKRVLVTFGPFPHAPPCHSFNGPESREKHRKSIKRVKNR